jgi:hypothetical protein
VARLYGEKKDFWSYDMLFAHSLGCHGGDLAFSTMWACSMKVEALTTPEKLGPIP